MWFKLGKELIWGIFKETTGKQSSYIPVGFQRERIENLEAESSHLLDSGVNQEGDWEKEIHSH